MADYNSLFQQSLYLSPEQRELLLTALASNNSSQSQVDKPSWKNNESDQSLRHTSPSSFTASPSGVVDPTQSHDTPFGLGDDESPFLDFNPEVDFDFQDTENLIGDYPGGNAAEAKSEESDALDLPAEYGEKRKEMDDDGLENETEESGKKRKESDDKASRKPGRKPLTSEPTTKRKAQNRAAQRAFRERKEKHLSDLEARVEGLQKASLATNQENGLLRAQVERLQVELKEYRKRISWMTSRNGMSAMSAIPSIHSNGVNGLNNDFLFDFPKLGSSPGTGTNVFNNGQSAKTNLSNSKIGAPAAERSSTGHPPGILTLDAFENSLTRNHQASATQSPSSRINATNTPNTGKQDSNGVNSTHTKAQKPKTSVSNSPSSSSESHRSQHLSSCRTSPEPNTTTPSADKPNDTSAGHHCVRIDGEKTFCEQLGLACGNINNPIPAVRSESASNTPNQNNSSENPTNLSEQPLGLDWLTQQNGGQFDPVLFGDWREPQDAVLSQDFDTFFNDAFHLPELNTENQQAPKDDFVSKINQCDQKSDDEEEVVPGEDKSQMLSCSKIWDRLQSMDRFRNGEIDVDNLCSELRTKARCSEGGVVVNEKDVECIMDRAGDEKR